MTALTVTPNSQPSVGDELVDNTNHTDSNKIAKLYGIRHDNMLQTIDRYIADLGDALGENCSLWFQECEEIKNLDNHPLPQKIRFYRLTEEAALIITGRMRGRKAAVHQAQLASAFVKMKRFINETHMMIEFDTRSELRRLQSQVHEASVANLRTTAFNQHGMLQYWVAKGYLIGERKPVHRWEYDVTALGEDVGFKRNKNGTILPPENW